MSSGQGPEDGAAAWTVDELMIATLAATLDNDDQACNGMASFIPVIAFQLARLTHAPDLVWLLVRLALTHGPTGYRHRLSRRLSGETRLCI